MGCWGFGEVGAGNDEEFGWGEMREPARAELASGPVTGGMGVIGSGINFWVYDCKVGGGLCPLKC